MNSDQPGPHLQTREPFDAQDEIIGEPMKLFMGQVMELAERLGSFKIHFASAREVIDMMIATLDGHPRESRPRDYKL